MTETKILCPGADRADAPRGLGQEAARTQVTEASLRFDWQPRSHTSFNKRMTRNQITTRARAQRPDGGRPLRQILPARVMRSTLSCRDKCPITWGEAALRGPPGRIRPAAALPGVAVDGSACISRRRARACVGGPVPVGLKTPGSGGRLPSSVGLWISASRCLPRSRRPATTSPPMSTVTWLRVAGHLPFKDDEILSPGRLGAEVDVPAGAEAARVATLNALASLRAALGSLDRIRRVIKVRGYVAVDPGVRRASPGDERCIGPDPQHLRRRGRRSHPFHGRRQLIAVQRACRDRAWVPDPPAGHVAAECRAMSEPRGKTCVCEEISSTGSSGELR